MFMIDMYIMEACNPTLAREDYMNMVVRKLNSKLENTWRVKIENDGQYRLTDFSLPPNQKNLPDARCLNEDTLPQWVKKRLAILQICEVGTIVNSVGQRVAENTYYVIE
jgi:hypothetical protein